MEVFELEGGDAGVRGVFEEERLAVAAVLGMRSVGMVDEWVWVANMTGVDYCTYSSSSAPACFSRLQHDNTQWFLFTVPARAVTGPGIAEEVVGHTRSGHSRADDDYICLLGKIASRAVRRQQRRGFGVPEGVGRRGRGERARGGIGGKGGFGARHG